MKQELPEFNYVDEPVKEWLETKDNQDKNLLTNFYEDKNRWSYTFQNYAFITRCKKLLNAIEKNKPKNIFESFKLICNRLIYGKKLIIFTERSILTDRKVFAEMLHDEKQINSMEWMMYLDWYKLFEETLKIDKVIYLRTEPEVSLKRVNKRARDEEKTVELDYLKSVHQKHEEWLLKNKTALVLDNNNDFQENPDVKQILLRQIKNFV